MSAPQKIKILRLPCPHVAVFSYSVLCMCVFVTQFRTRLSVASEILCGSCLSCPPFPRIRADVPGVALTVYGERLVSLI